MNRDLRCIVGTLAQQKRLDVLTNNLANVNTPGFKKDKAVLRWPSCRKSDAHSKTRCFLD